MMYRGHALLGLAVAESSAAATSMSAVHALVWIPVATLCSLWPDLDGAGARLAKLLPPITTILSWLTRKLAKHAFLRSKTPMDTGEVRIHRGLSHTPVYILVCSAVLWGSLASSTNLALLVSLAFLVGNLAHLLGDAFSLSGLPLLWPIRVKGKRWFDVKAPEFMRFRVGAEVETAILTPLMFVLALLGAIWYVKTLIGG